MGGRRSCQVVWLRGRYIYGPATPRIRARRCRAKVSGAAGPATSAVPQACAGVCVRVCARVWCVDCVYALRERCGKRKEEEVGLVGRADPEDGVQSDGRPPLSITEKWHHTITMVVLGHTQ